MPDTTPTPPPEQQLTALYIAAEVALLFGAARILRSTLTLGPIAALPKLRRLVQQITDQLALHTGPLVQAMTAAQAAKGRQDADKQIARLTGRDGSTGGSGGRVPPPGTSLDLTGDGGYFDLSLDHGDRAAQAIRDDLTSSLDDVRFRLTRLPDDIYKAIAPHGGIHQVLDNNVTPEQAQAAAWRVFTQSGVTGFTDRSGRDWALSSYVEMAVRTASNRAYNASHTARMTAVGIHYFTIPEHVHPCPQCFAWQHGILTDLDTPDPAVDVIGTVAEAVAAGWNHPNCFPDFTRVASPTGVRAADSRWYEGDLVVIHTASGDELSVTPNHPVLTPEGWVAAGSLVVGDRVIRHRPNVERVDLVSPRDQQVEARIGDVFDALRHASGVTAGGVPGAPEQFHGDGSDAEVEVVLVHSLLSDGGKPELGEPSGDRPLFVGGVRFGSLLPSSAADEILMGSRRAPDGSMRPGREFEALCPAHAREAALHGVALRVQPTLAEVPVHGADVHAEALSDLGRAVATFVGGDDISDTGLGLGGAATLDVSRALLAADAAVAQANLDPTPADAEGGRDLLRSLAGQVSTDDIIEVDRRHFAGHVYNLESGDGWYVAESILVHNCRCTLVPYFPDISTPPEAKQWTGDDQLRYEATQKQRRLEVEIRKAKRAEQTALTPEARAEAKADVRAGQARIRAHLAQHPTLGRQSRREQPHLRMNSQPLAPWMPPGRTTVPRHPDPDAPVTGDPPRP